ncbi:piggyBac transposable element-derived protein 2-like isoform X2 [Rhopilema esculentum]|eukprot:gene16606-8037_t
MNRNQCYNFEDALKLITADDSDVSDFSYDTDTEHLSQILAIEDQEAKSSDEEEHDESNEETSRKKHVYRWRKMDVPQMNDEFKGNFSEPPENWTPYDYFKKMFTDKTVKLIVEQTNLYSVQKTGSSINVTEDEISSFIGMHLHMGIVKLPSCTSYWAKNLRYHQIADVMPLKRFTKIKRFMHFVDNDMSEGQADKLFKINPIIDAVRDECRKIEPEEFQTVDEQIIPSKTKYSKIRQYNPKKPKKWGFKNLVRAGGSGIMYDFFIYAGKDSNEDPQYNHLSKSAQVVAKLCKSLPCHMNHKVFFDNWFSTMELMRYMKNQGLLAVGTIRANRLQGCPLQSNKDLEKNGRGSMDYRVDANSGIIVVKWVDNSTVLLVSNYVGVEQIGAIERWSKESKARKDIPCPYIVIMYNKSMGGVDLADMLIALYRIEVKTKRWYIKVFWHLVDICKVNGWLLYRRHSRQLGLPAAKQKPFLQFCTEIATALINIKKAPQSSRLGRPTKHPSTEANSHGGKRAAQPTPINDIRYDQTGHWPLPSADKKRCRVCQSYSRMTCEKCKIALCLITSRNCFKKFHTDK